MNRSVPNVPDDDDTVEAIAAGWIAQRDEGLTDVQAAEFALWKTSDPRNAAAAAMVERTWNIFQRMPQLRTDSRLSRELEKLESGESTRRNRVWFHRIGLAAAAALAVAIGVWQLAPVSDEFVQTYVTSEMGYERVPLPDGSVVELNRATEITLNFSAKERDVTLTNGEAHFTVAKNSKRPFIVNVGGIAVKAVGTAFNVRLAQGAVEVLVTQGQVQVGKLSDLAISSTPASSDVLPVYIAGQRVIVPAESTSSISPVVVNDDPSAMLERLSWQGPRLVFRETPLSEVVGQFNRRNTIQLSIGDPELAVRPVGGSFRADQLASFVELLEESREISVERTSPTHFVLRKVR